MKKTKILVHLDISQMNDVLMKKLKQITQQENVKVELFACCYNSSLHRSYLFDEKAEKHAIAGFLHGKEKALIKLAEQLEASGGEVAGEVSYDVAWHRNAAEGIVRKAIRYQADMVISVIGKHPQGHYLFRQGDWQLIAQCPVPLLLMRGQDWSAHPRVAALVDPFHESDKPKALDHEILESACLLVDLLVGELHVAHSFTSIPQSAIFDEHLTLDYTALHKKVKKQHTTALKSLMEDNKALASGILHLEDGEVHKVIPEMVQREHIDLLVMGSIARGFLDRFLIGSSVERIVDHVNCDILLVKQPGFISPVTENSL